MSRLKKEKTIKTEKKTENGFRRLKKISISFAVAKEM